MKTITHPSTDEYNEFYAGYVQRAIARKNVIATLPKQIEEVRSALVGGASLNARAFVAIVEAAQA